jgi:hypothetical protein
MRATITIPDNLNEITLKQYKRFLEVTKDLEGEFYKQRFVEILCGIPFAKVKLMKQIDINSIVKDITAMLESDAPFINRFSIQTQELGFIPELEAMTSGEYADLTTYIADFSTMHKAMAVLYRPVIRKDKDNYSIMEYNGTELTADLMEFMPLGVVMGAMFFFYTLTNDLLNAIQVSMEEELKEVKRELTASQHSSVKSGGGINTFIRSQMESLKGLIKRQSKT